MDQREVRKKRDLEKIELDVTYRRKIEGRIEDLNQEEKKKRQIILAMNEAHQNKIKDIRTQMTVEKQEIFHTIAMKQEVIDDIEYWKEHEHEKRLDKE